ncbi:MAG: hypothetical protein IPK53_16860 [bacterium]|nr:hypothetical protein [bacterium]
MFSRPLALPLVFACVVFVMMSCKNDKKITGPDNPDPGAYSLELRPGDDTLQYFVENHIVIRLYRGTGMAVNDTVLLRTESNVGFLDENLVIPQSDTIAHPCGANPCVDYICDDQNIGKDVIFGYAIADGETVATASVSFFVEP